MLGWISQGPVMLERVARSNPPAGGYAEARRQAIAALKEDPVLYPPPAASWDAIRRYMPRAWRSLGPVDLYERWQTASAYVRALPDTTHVRAHFVREWHWHLSGMPLAAARTSARPVVTLPKGAWLLHGTDEVFESFDRGAVLARAGFTGGNNLEEALKTGEGEHVFGFGDTLEHHRGFRSSMPPYGEHAVIFQTDYAVLYHHAYAGRSEAMWPIGSEYSVHTFPYVRQMLRRRNIPTLGDLMDLVMAGTVGDVLGAEAEAG